MGWYGLVHTHRCIRELEEIEAGFACNLLYWLEHLRGRIFVFILIIHQLPADWPKENSDLGFLLNPFT